jgi:hypothetical protein
MAGTGKGASPRQQLFGRQFVAAITSWAVVGGSRSPGEHCPRVHGSLESGERSPSLDAVARLASALEVDAADLVRVSKTCEAGGRSKLHQRTPNGIRHRRPAGVRRWPART